MTAHPDPMWDPFEASDSHGNDDLPTGSHLAQVETPGAKLLRCFHAGWRTLILRGVQDPAFHQVLSELRDTVAGIWETGDLARLELYGSGLRIGEETLSPFSSGNLLARIVAEEMLSMELHGFVFMEPWDDAEVARFLHLLEDWRQSVPPFDTRVEELEAMGIRGIALLDPQAVEEEPASGWDSIEELGSLRKEARKTFFKALQHSKNHLRSVTGDSVIKLRRTRQVVHNIIDTLVAEEFSLLAMTSLCAFDEQTFLHSVNVCVLATALGQRLGLNRRELSELGVAAFFHDLGKMTVPKQVLNKPGTFTPTEWRIVQTHPLEGVRTLLGSGDLSPLAIKVMLVSLEHHMRYDLSGYPRVDDNWEIGVASRIVSIADCYDAMTSHRAYEDERLIPHRVMLHMMARSGKNFDPVLMRLFVNLMGLYPVGSLVELVGGELGVVVATDPQDPATPVVRMVRDSAGTEIDMSSLHLVNLADVERTDGTCITQALDPEEIGIDLSAYLL
jgi:HD-GYP domain-containing protein (c-di-GMP phosphodiesterase class II)